MGTVTVVEVSRELIIKAILTEPLRACAWTRKEEGASPRAKVGTEHCSVCAVGAVLRRTIDPQQPLSAITEAAVKACGGDTWNPYSDSGFIVEDQAEDLCRRGRHLNGLSVLFEGLAGRWAGVLGVSALRLPKDAMDKIRSELVEFVLAHFPERVCFDIGGVRPSRHARVTYHGDV